MSDPIVDTRIDAARVLEDAREVLRIEAQAIEALVPKLGDAFVAAVALVLACRGRVVVSGIGKSGHVARKIAATLASTGTPAFFVHPAEASHGDLGMITADDVMLALSNSGSTEELVAIVPLVKRRGARLVAVTGQPGSPLARLADVHLEVAVAREACPLNLAPTASTTAALALGDDAPTWKLKGVTAANETLDNLVMLFCMQNNLSFETQSRLKVVPNF